MSKNLVLLYSPFKIFSPAKFEIQFNPISQKDTRNLLITLMNENYNLLNHSKKSDTYVSIFNEDIEYLPSFYSKPTTKIFTRTNADNWRETSELVSNLFLHGYTKIIILLGNSILSSPNLISDVFDMMSTDIERLILGSTTNEKFAFIGFNYTKIELFNNFNKNDFDFDYLLRKSIVECAEVITINQQRICLSFNDVIDLCRSYKIGQFKHYSFQMNLCLNSLLSNYKNLILSR
ncbi:MAG: hypothetical protein N3A61_04520 [Ignavibacteria bacterium]|nr:hypothetical protein [Ignavibacteria bacterium]